MNKPTIVAASALTALVLAGGIGVGVASADPTTTPSPSPTSSATSAATPTAKATDRAKAGHPKRELAARALHGEATLGGKKKTRVVDFQRGTVTAVSATSLSVQSADGFDATYVIAPATTVRKKKAPAKITDIATGDRVRVVALREGTTVTAKRIGDAGPR